MITNHKHRRNKKSFNFSNEKYGHVALFFKPSNKAAQIYFSHVSTIVFYRYIKATVGIFREMAKLMNFL